MIESAPKPQSEASEQGSKQESVKTNVDQVELAHLGDFVVTIDDVINNPNDKFFDNIVKYVSRDGEPVAELKQLFDQMGSRLKDFNGASQRENKQLSAIRAELGSQQLGEGAAQVEQKRKIEILARRMKKLQEMFGFGAEASPEPQAKVEEKTKGTSRDEEEKKEFKRQFNSIADHITDNLRLFSRVQDDRERKGLNNLYEDSGRGISMAARSLGELVNNKELSPESLNDYLGNLQRSLQALQGTRERVFKDDIENLKGLSFAVRQLADNTRELARFLNKEPEEYGQSAKGLERIMSSLEQINRFLFKRMDVIDRLAGRY